MLTRIIGAEADLSKFFLQVLIGQPGGYGLAEMIKHSEFSDELIRSPCGPSLQTQGPLSSCKLFDCTTAVLDCTTVTLGLYNIPLAHYKKESRPHSHFYTH